MKTTDQVEITKMIDEMISDYTSRAEDCYQELGDEQKGREHDAGATALEELKARLGL